MSEQTLNTTCNPEQYRSCQLCYETSEETFKLMDRVMSIAGTETDPQLLAAQDEAIYSMLNTGALKTPSCWVNPNIANALIANMQKELDNP